MFVMPARSGLRTVSAALSMHAVLLCLSVLADASVVPVPDGFKDLAAAESAGRNCKTLEEQQREECVKCQRELPRASNLTAFKDCVVRAHAGVESLHRSACHTAACHWRCQS